MKTSSKKEINLVPHPKDNPNFIGHDRAINVLASTTKGGRMPQSWLFTGPKGIGKATLAYRFARFILSGTEVNLSDKKLYVSPDHQTFKRISSGSHSDLLVLEPDVESASGDIKVDNIRKINDFLRMTASETANRIVIIDSADDMNINAANALLKLLEEPPVGAIFILISHTPGRLLPTIKSRCRDLRMTSLKAEDAGLILSTALPTISAKEAMQLTALAEGSPGVAIDLYHNEGIALYKALLGILGGVPKISSSQVQKLSDMVTKKDDKKLWEIFSYLINIFLLQIIRSEASAAAMIEIIGGESDIKNKLIVEKTLAELMKIWEKINSLISDTDRVNLDKKAVIISIFEEF